MSDFYNESFWTFFIAIGTLGGIAWLVYLLMISTRIKIKPNEEVKSTGHSWDGIEELNNPLPFWWVAMFYITIIFSLIYLVLYPGIGTYKGLLGWTSAGEHQAEVAAAEAKFGPLYAKYASTELVELSKNQDALYTGSRLFANNCAICHGADARGARGFPNLTDNDWLYGGEPAQIKTSIMQGRNGVMPAWKDALGEAGIKQVASYVLSLSGREVDSSEIEEGMTKFNLFCAGCHTPEGTGMTVLGAPNLTDNIWLFGASRGRIEKTISNGRSGVMPAHEELLGKDKVHILAAYIYSLSQK